MSIERGEGFNIVIFHDGVNYKLAHDRDRGCLCEENKNCRHHNGAINGRHLKNSFSRHRFNLLPVFSSGVLHGLEIIGFEEVRRISQRGLSYSVTAGRKRYFFLDVCVGDHFLVWLGLLRSKGGLAGCFATLRSHEHPRVIGPDPAIFRSDICACKDVITEVDMRRGILRRWASLSIVTLISYLLTPIIRSVLLSFNRSNDSNLQSLRIQILNEEISWTSTPE